MSYSKHMRFDRSFQHGVLKLMLDDPQFCQKCCELLEPQYFADKLSWYFSIIKEHFVTTNHAPTRDAFTGQISYFKEVARQIEYTDELNAIYGTTPDADTIKKYMTGYVRANIFVDAAQNAAGMYNSDKKAEAYDYIKKRVEELHEASFEKDRYSRFGDWQAVVDQAKLETQGAIPTGIQAIDEQIKGLLPGTFTVWLGAPNAGKSMIGPTLAKQAAKQGKRTFVTIHEDEEIPTKLRYLACFADVELNKLMYTPGLLSPDETSRLEKADKLLKEHVVLRFMYTTEATIEAVMDAARSLKREWDYHLLICDYGQCLTTRDKTASKEVRHLHEHIYHMLKQLCLELKIAGTGGAQVNRNAMSMSRSGAEWLRCTDVSEAFGIIKKATNVITMNRSMDDIERNRIVFLLDKARSGRCPIGVECVSKYSHGMAYCPDQQQSTVDVAKNGPAKQEDEETFGPRVLQN